MKIFKLLTFILFLYLQSGCLKEKEIITSEGEWILVDATLYIKRWGNYPLMKFNHFSSSNNRSCLDLSGNEIKLDQITQYQTKWTLPKQKGFILNDTVSYEDQSNAYSMRIYPTEDGSARIFLLDCIKKDYTVWTTSEREQALTINGIYDNYTYFSKLTFKRKEATTNSLPDCIEHTPATLAGTVPKGNFKDLILKGQKWVVYKYKWEGFNSYESISDTMTFLTNSTYYYAEKNQILSYALYDMGNYYSMSLNHTRFGANISSSSIPKFGIENGDVQNAIFKDNTVGNNGEKVILFFRRIQ
jgi:hypothetical protein